MIQTDKQIQGEVHGKKEKLSNCPKQTHFKEKEQNKTKNIKRRPELQVLVKRNYCSLFIWNQIICYTIKC